MCAVLFSVLCLSALCLSVGAKVRRQWRGTLFKKMDLQMKMGKFNLINKR